jgi:hypothetical protein
MEEYKRKKMEEKNGGISIALDHVSLLAISSPRMLLTSLYRLVLDF